MQTPSIIVAILAFLMPLLAEAAISTYSQTGCITELTTKKQATVPTVTVSKTTSLTVKVTVTSTPTSTKTPPSTTVTTVSTSTSSTTTTLPQLTDTITTTTISTETDITTTTVTSTAFSTSTVTTTSTPTTTIPTSAGFTPLASVLSMEGFTPGKKKRRSPGQLQPRAAAAEKAKADAVILPRATTASMVGLIGGPSTYPEAVGCYRFVEVVSTSTITATAKTTTTVIAAPGTVTTTSTTTVKTTITSTLVDASSTVAVSTSTTVTTTATASTTTTSTVTSTTTVVASQATFYAACDTNNIISTINGNPIRGSLPKYGSSSTTANSAYDCCVTCLNFAGCGSSLYANSGPPLGQCYLINDSGTCTGAEQDQELSTAVDDGITAVASNSNCGQAYFDNYNGVH